jgi:hypothetical protein
MNSRTATQAEKSNEETKTTDTTRTEKESILGKIVSKVLGKPVKPDQTLKSVQLPVQSAMAERKEFASRLGNGTIVINEKVAIKEMEEQTKDRETKVREDEQKTM